MISTEVLAANAAPVAEPDGPNGELGRDDFLAMLVAQLENQDPLNPQEGTEFTAQLAQFTSLEQLLNMRESIDSLVAVQTQAQSADRSLENVNLIGKNVLVASNQFEIPAGDGALPQLGFELSEPSRIDAVSLIDADTGELVSRFAPGGVQPSGFTRLDWSDFQIADGVPAPGSYRIVFEQPADESAARAMIEGRVTGTSAQGGVIYLGEQQVSVDDLREVRE